MFEPKRETSRRIVTRFLAVTLCLSLSGAVAPAWAKEKKADDALPQGYSAFAVVMGNVATGSRSTVSINITRWSTEEEHDQLLETIMNEDNQTISEELGRMGLPTPA